MCALMIGYRFYLNTNKQRWCNVKNRENLTFSKKNGLTAPKLHL